LFGKCGKFRGTVLCQFGHGVFAFPQ
jgi:hypothetical protein